MTVLKADNFFVKVKKKSRLKNRPAHQAIGRRWVGGEPPADIYLSAKYQKT